MIPITVIIPCKQDYERLTVSLPAVNDCEQVIVVDSHYHAMTAQLCLAQNAEYVTFEWNGMYPKKRNWALENCRIRNRWVLFLDTDEIVTSAFLDEATRAISGSDDVVAYRVRYRNRFLCGWLNHGEPTAKIALFRHEIVRYEYIDEHNWSNFDMEIHEHPIIHGSVGILRNPVIHNEDRSLEDYLSKHREYARWEVERSRQVAALPSMPSLRLRQRIKYRLLGNPLVGVGYFVYSYIIRLGFLDGRRGLIFALLKMIYFTEIAVRLLARRVLCERTRFKAPPETERE